MKKFLMRLSICLLIVVLSLSQISVSAVVGTYCIDEMELEVTIPSEYSVITRDTPGDAAIFGVLGTSKATLMSQFENSGIYLNAISSTLGEEIVVTNLKNDLTNFTLLSDTMLDTFTTTLFNEYANRGIEVLKHDIYKHSQAKFIRLYWFDEASSAYGLQYYTIYNGNAMNFTIRSYVGRISPTQESTIKSIVDSIKYDNAPPVLEEGEDTDAFKYTDSDSNVKFTVPANWVEEEFNEEREYLDVKFVSTKEDGCLIMFSSTDVWGEASPAEKLVVSRSDMNNSLFSKADIAEMGNTTEDNVSVVTYDGVEYYKCETTYTKEAYGVSVDITMTQLIYMDNGWMYTFQFGGTSEHKLYPDFEKLLNSVEYPTNKTVKTDSDDESLYVEDDYDEYSTDNSGVIAFGIILVIAGIVEVVFLIKRIKNKSNRPSSAVTTVYCRKCGQALSHDSDFCHMCGAKVEKENES